MAEIKITAANFEEEVMKSDVPVVLDFWATWCGPCNMIAPVLKELADEYEGKVKVGKVNVDEEGALAAQFGVTGIPYIVKISDGAIAGSMVEKKHIAESAGTLSTSNAMFVFLLIFIVMLIGALSFFPALALGPIAEHFLMLG